MKDFKIELIQENQILEFTFNKDKPGSFDGEVYGMDISTPNNGYIKTIGGKLTGSLLASEVNGLTGNVSKITHLDKIVYLVRAYNKGDFFDKENELLVNEYNYDKLIDRSNNTNLIKYDILKILFIYFTERLLKPVDTISLYSSLFYEIPEIYKAILLLKETGYVNVTPSNHSHWFMTVRLRNERYEELERRFSGFLKQQKNYINKNPKSFDFFICHASEDKQVFVNELAKRLREEAYNVWYDDLVLRLGDSIRRKIEEGLKISQHGIVVLSENFFKKEWPQKELDGLFHLESEKKKIIPIWLDLDYEDVKRYSPILADRKGMKFKFGEDSNDFFNRFLEQAKKLFDMHT